MKSFRSLLFLAVSSFLFAAAPASAKPGWLTDYKQALEEAKAGNKRLLIDFTGSDWCGWCIRLDREVFSKPEFAAYAEKHLVLLEADFPRAKQIPAAVKAQNSELAQRFEVEGFPTIVVLDGTGKQIGALGYMPGGPEAFIAELDRLPKG
ncbi:MAG: thioredoxin family protein [Chthoniobacterales bacterium]